MIRNLFLFLFALLLWQPMVFAQDTTFARQIITTLCGDRYAGRGYVNGGDSKAASFLAGQFAAMGLQPVGESFFQEYSFPVNTFPGKTDVVLNDKLLVPGKDFIVSPDCPSVKGSFKLKRWNADSSISTLDVPSAYFLVVANNATDSIGKAWLKSFLKEPPKVAGIVLLEQEKLTWSVARKQSRTPVIKILQSVWQEENLSIKVNIQSKLVADHKAKNVIATIRGRAMPDSFIVFSAHYDHLGMMGKKAIFPGANDNASGVAMVLNLAKHFSDSAHRPEKSVAFMLFSGEEAGLLGSAYYCSNPVIPLNQINFLINLDLMGTGEEGVMVVNGAVYEKAFDVLDEINQSTGRLSEVGKRGRARNSDHYYFSENGVPAFFLYTMGGSKAYHDINDVPAVLSLAGYNGVFELITSFVQQLEQKGYLLYSEKLQENY